MNALAADENPRSFLPTRSDGGTPINVLIKSDISTLKRLRHCVSNFCVKDVKKERDKSPSRILVRMVVGTSLQREKKETWVV